MKVFYFSISIVMIFPIFIFAQPSTLASSIKIETIKPFWRSQPVIGRWLNTGQGLIQIPNYMSENSFPYIKKHNFEKEVPFADALSVVRLLGGWNYSKKSGELYGQKNADLVYMEKGKLHYRWDLLKNRLDPYILAGYKDLTLVLDNIPWDFPKKAKLNTYGQVNPPYNLKKWETFIEKINLGVRY